MTRSLLLLAMLAVGCTPPAPLPTSAPAPVAAAKPAPGFDAGVEYLLKQQSPDGWWRSDVYATFKDGTALTPLVIVSLQSADKGEVERKKAAGLLAKMTKDDGSIDEGKDGLPYPVYTAALSVIALSHPENARHVKARDAWLNYLLARQLTQQNGWEPTDKPYGGWGYYPRIPKKPVEGEIVPAQQLLESNLSATRFALAAMAASRPNAWTEPAGPVGIPKSISERAFVAMQFAGRCGNADGGYHFIYDDPVRNKAGAVAIPMAAPTFHSYGSATADGLLATLYGWALTARCATGGEQIGDSSAAWLTKNFAADTHPGTYIPTHEPNRNAVYFYYAATVAQAFNHKGVKDVNGKPWAKSLSEALLAKQKPDGSWENPVQLVRENDPVLATAYAVQALAECKRGLVGDAAKPAP